MSEGPGFGPARRPRMMGPSSVSKWPITHRECPLLGPEDANATAHTFRALHRQADPSNLLSFE